jgi:hypothetical protein
MEMSNMQTPAQPPAPVPPPEFQSAKIDTLDEAALIALLKDRSATVFQKAKACQRLATVGTKEAVPALARLLTDMRLAHYARYALEPIPDPAVDDALRVALARLRGRPMIGLLDSIGKRKDVKAVPGVAKLLHNYDPEIAQAAAACLGAISGPEAAKAIEGGLLRTKGAVRNSVAAAGLVCAEGLLAQGARDQALDLYTTLSRPDIPKNVRLGAMHGIIFAETALNRPR